MKQSIFERITQQIADAIADGADAYVMPWHRTGDDLATPANASSGRAYRGLNVITLWLTAEAEGYRSGHWATYRQWSEMGAQVRKGERGTPIFFWERRQSRDQPDNDRDDDQRQPNFIAKSFTVFNAEQVCGYQPKPVRTLPETERLVRVEAFARATGAMIEYGGDCACYVADSDTVQMPPFVQFRTPEAYYSVLAHELTHWTGAKQRLDRQLGGHFGLQAYAMEELIAELGAAFTCARLGIATEPRSDHAPYIASWLKVLRGDPRAIFTAASEAQEAADYLSRFGEAEASQVEALRAQAVSGSTFRS